MTRLYVAGPMRNYPEWNFPAFADATLILRDAGYGVISPAEEDLKRGFDPKAPVEEYTDADWHKAMRRDFAYILKCQGIALLDGWERSKGAQAERFVAETIGIPVKPVKDWLAEAKDLTTLVCPCGGTCR